MFQRIKEIIDKGRTFLVTTHVDPDGDAVGSAFALCLALAGMGKDAAVYLQDPVPYRYGSSRGLRSSTTGFPKTRTTRSSSSIAAASTGWATATNP